MLFNVIKRMIQRGQTDGIREKMDILFVAGSLSEAEYGELLALLEDEPDA